MIWLYYSYMAWFCMLYHNKRHRLYRFFEGIGADIMLPATYKHKKYRFVN